MDTGTTLKGLDTLTTASYAAATASSPATAKTAENAATKATTASAATAAVGDAATKAAAPSKTELKNSVDAINRFLKDTSEVQFSIDEDSGKSVIKVVDTETKKVLNQFPSEQSLEISKNLSSYKGMIINSKA